MRTVPVPIRRLSVPALLLAAAVVLLPVAFADAGGRGRTAKTFKSFESAWSSASAKQVTALMAPKGQLKVSLLAPKTGGTWTEDQARRGLETYFGERGVSGPKLKVIAPKKGKLAKTVRIYEYTYRPHGEDERTTRLTVTVKKAGKKRWVLASVVESPKQ